jgi:hypothetical protein
LFGWPARIAIEANQMAEMRLAQRLMYFVRDYLCMPGTSADVVMRRDANVSRSLLASYFRPLAITFTKRANVTMEAPLRVIPFMSTRELQASMSVMLDLPWTVAQVDCNAFVTGAN